MIWHGLPKAKNLFAFIELPKQQFDRSQVEFDLDVTEILTPCQKSGTPDDVCGLFKPLSGPFEF